MANSGYDIAIAGGGAIGLSIGWQLAADGASVVVVDSGVAGRAATSASGGMLGAQAEVGFEDLDVYHLGMESMRLWPGFASELEEDSGIRIDYRDEGTLMVAHDRDGAANLKRVYDFQQFHDVPVQWISPAEAQSIEPLLTPRITAAVYSKADHQVDPIEMVRALREAFVRKGGELLELTAIRSLELDGANPVWNTESGEKVEAATVILAAGCWSGNIAGLPDGPAPVRPVKGQMIELRMADPYTLQTVVRASGTYLAPKLDGRLLVGSTSEEMGYDTRVTAGGMYDILERAWRLVPGIYDMVVTDSWAGLRPASPDHAPIIGFGSDPRVLYATGHYRHGILLTPVTASSISACIRDRVAPELIGVCEPPRFRKTEPANG
ncbi:MAG: glycine oxidase ThiO [Rhodothermia bacterium]